MRSRAAPNAGKPTLGKPLTGEVSQVGDEFKTVLPMQFTVSLNRTGKYRAELMVRDNLGKKTAKHAVEFSVVDPAARPPIRFGGSRQEAQWPRAT